MRILLALLAVIGTLGCGPQVVRRPLYLDISGVSGRAERLVVKVVDEAREVRCADVELQATPQIVADMELSWTRSSGAERSLAFEDVGVYGITLIVYTEDATGTPIQLACAELDYAEIEAPDRTIELSRP